MQYGYYGNFFVRPNGPLQKGDVVRLHKHNFDHVLMVFEGAVHVHAILPDGRVIDRAFGRVHPNGRYCLIAAGVGHEITATEDGTAFDCLFSLRDSDGSVVEHPTGFMAAFE